MTDTTTTPPLSVLDLLKENYPSQFYGVPDADGTILAEVIDVWAGKNLNGIQTDVTQLPAASALVPLTADQFGLARSVTNIGVSGTTLLYPSRFYATYDTTAAQPTGITGWFDTWTLSTTKNLPAASDMLALTQDQWNDRATGPQGVKDDDLVDYTPPAPVVPLETQAQTELAWIASQASMAAAMGETFTDNMKAYVKAIQAIANGTDTTSTALPARPATIMN
ncbi:hypothetical protein [Gluconobacter kondonii]|uniref:hypothetical protein n=1 Tax=Gluconobacter kondonii TaxID=941463 RepID=UPI001B8C6D89|nr:hypothetical protein [Gluconobacter kondonii]MBS1082466.1 hypothetical protein [Gluconobacter kondonii]